MEKQNVILSAQEEQALLQPIDEYVGGIQKKIDALREDGTDRVLDLTTHLQVIKESKILSREEKEALSAQDRTRLEKAKAVEAKNRAEVDRLVADAANYISQHYDSEYLNVVKASGKAEKAAAQEKYNRTVAELKAASAKSISELKAKAASAPESEKAKYAQELKDENYVAKRSS